FLSRNAAAVTAEQRGTAGGLDLACFRREGAVSDGGLGLQRDRNDAIRHYRGAGVFRPTCRRPPFRSWSVRGMNEPGVHKRVLIIVENLPVPFDRRVWQEATALHSAGYLVSIICPAVAGYDARYDEIEGIAIYRHPLPVEADGAGGYLLEYGAALFWQFRLALRVLRERGFDAIHACNPPDLIFV